MQALLAIDVGLLVAVIGRYAAAGRSRSEATLVAAVAMAVRLAAVFIVSQLGRGNFPEGICLNDEASFWRATEALLPDPWASSVPPGLDHLSGSAYLGLTTAIGELSGLDPTGFRLASVGFGTLCALL